MQIKDITFGLPLRKVEMRIEKVSRMVEWKRWELRRWMVSIIKNGRMVKWKRWDEKEWSDTLILRFRNGEKKRESENSEHRQWVPRVPNEFWFFKFYLYFAARVLFFLGLGLLNPLEFFGTLNRNQTKPKIFLEFLSKPNHI